MPERAPSTHSSTAAQQAVLERIHAQRARLRQHRSARQQARAQGIARGERVDPAAPLPDRLLAFARLHPVASTAALALAALAGPARLVRWTGWLLPLAARLWRRP